jgi:hypothetical protein
MEREKIKQRVTYLFFEIESIRQEECWVQWSSVLPYIPTYIVYLCCERWASIKVGDC